MARMLVKNLQKFTLAAYSWNDNFNTIIFKPEEVLDLSGFQINSPDNWAAFVRAYVRTNILTLIPIYIEPPAKEIIVPVIPEGYFDYAYVDYGWVV